MIENNDAPEQDIPDLGYARVAFKKGEGVGKEGFSVEVKLAMSPNLTVEVITAAAFEEAAQLRRKALDLITPPPLPDLTGQLQDSIDHLKENGA